MTTSNYVQSDFSADDQIVELTEAQLEAVEGGGKWGRRFQTFRRGIKYINGVIN